MENLKKLIEEKLISNPELRLHPNFDKRLKWELIEIDLQDQEKYFLDLYASNKKYETNENNLLICKILGICNHVNLDVEPKTKMGEFPDVDVDYLPIVRDYLKNTWAPQKFGKSKVCNIGNYSTFGLKSTLIDMARVHSLDRNEILNITTNLRMKDDEGDILTFDKALEIYPELKSYCDRNPQVAEATKKLLHRNRSMGKHAGGLILCNQDIASFVPLVRGGEGETVSAWVEGLHGQDLGPVGLIKFDLLVVNGLAQIAQAVKLVKERHNLKYICAYEGQWDWSDTAYLNDPLSMDMANKADLKCIFQYDSEGIRKLVAKGGVDSFDDLVAYVSIYRPSALDVGADEKYVNRKKGKENYEVPEILQDALGKTYGLFIYQEQVMQVLNIVGKIPLRDCYQVIKAISKKNLSAFQKFKDKFVENGQETLGHSKEQMEEYWNTIEAWAGYGFNKTLTEDTIIYCVEGAKQIKDICAGDKVFCVNEKGEQAQTEVVAVHDHGVIDVVEVTFDDGYKVKCTLDHKFLTEEGQIPLWKITSNNLAVLSSPLENIMTKPIKWETPCGLNPLNRTEYYKHVKTCLICKEKRREKKLSKKSRCGMQFTTKKELSEHLKICQICLETKWRFTGKKYFARCGMELLREKHLAEHHRQCEKCTEIKKKNIKDRMDKLNKDNLAPERKAIFSATAKKTSARKDVQEARAAQLKRWRDNNPEDFAKSIEKAQRAPKKSKMEIWLRKELGWKPKKICCGKDRRFVDLVKKNIWIEVDGPFHFWQIGSTSNKRGHNLEYTQTRDQMLKDECIKRKNVTLIRISLKCFTPKTGEMKQEWLALLQTMLQSPIPGVWCIGEFYELCPWAKNNVTILRLP